ncbi:MAG: hypothetical protein M3Z06_12405 [Actinomycetota bacterium]|nr:hypothetical protein [Actinomycetota bacterium]
MANREGVPSFGGVWHVLRASAAKAKTPTSTTTTAPYTYPARASRRYTS